MAQVVVKVIGGQPQNLDASTVRDVKQKLNALTHTAIVNGESVDDTYQLMDNEFVSLAPAVKGARQRLPVGFTGSLPLTWYSRYLVARF